jgi:AcrR family transcriptional regulator
MQASRVPGQERFKLPSRTSRARRDPAAALPDPLPIPREDQMLDELEAIFLREGFRSVTVDRLARDLRCSKRSLYMLASSKEALFLRVFDRYLSRLREEGMKGAMSADAVDAFEPYLAPAVSAARKLSTTLMRDMMAYPPAHEMWERHTSERMAGLRRLVQRCVDDGLFRQANAFLVAEVVAASLRRIAEPRFLAASKMSYREAVEELYGLLLHGLMHRAADAAGTTR